MQFYEEFPGFANIFEKFAKNFPGFSQEKVLK